MRRCGAGQGAATPTYFRVAYQRILPKQKRGYYREYTVKTPGERTRGARRIVAGKPGEYYYTADHYSHFKRIVE